MEVKDFYRPYRWEGTMSGEFVPCDVPSTGVPVVGGRGTTLSFLPPFSIRCSPPVVTLATYMGRQSPRNQ